MKISRYFETMKKAEQYKNRLYKSYNSVKLVYFPMFKESGIYEFEVK